MRAPIQNPDAPARSLAAAIAEGAAGLYDRLAVPGHGDGPAPPSDDLEPWVRAFSPEGPEALMRRLGWDGLDPAAVMRAIAQPAAPAPLPSWTLWLPRFADEARRLAQDDGAAAAGEASLPFVELWLPVVRAARAELLSRMGDGMACLAPAALAVLERQLLREAATTAAPAAFERFRARLEQDPGSPVGDASSRVVYTAFIREALEDGLTPLFSEYPVMARLLAVLAETWTEATRELAARLLADRSALSETFAGKEPLGPVASVESGMGDRHHGGRRVMILAFAGGARVVYKPRDLGLEAAYHRFLGWAASEGLDVPPPLRVIAREGYGWVEFAAQGRFEDLDDVRQYFRRAGALMCLTYVLRGRDLHMENVVASSAGPQLVDTEMLVQPEPAGVGVLPGSRDARAAADDGRGSCLETGLLSMFQRDPEGVMFDIGGLRGAAGGRAPVARRVWKALGTDGLHFVLDGRFEPTARNGVRLGAEDQRPEDFAEEMVSGLVAAYLFLLERRDALLAPGGPATVFAGQRVRVLLRTTTQYGALQYVLTAPQYQRSGLRRSFALDSLNRCFAQDRHRPILWPLVADERRALEQLDIPHFTVESTATTAYSEAGEPVVGYFRRSGYDAVLDRLRGLSEEDLAAQVGALRGTLASSVDSRFQTAAPSGDGRATVEDRLVEHAVWIGRELLAHAEEGDDLTWLALGSGAGRPGWGPHHLYDGTAGPVLFLAALAAVTGEPAWADAARAAVRPLARALDAGDRARRTADDDPVGVAAGLASVAYALGLSGELLGEDAFLELALEIAAQVTPERIEADAALDVVGGAAGAALALTALHRLRGEGWLIERASRSAQRLLDAAVEPMAGALAWPAADGRLLAGFGHGAAGIALALVRVAEATGESRLVDAARAAHRYERNLFSAPQRNWRIVGPNTFMAAWCHGAPGVGLGRALSLDTLDDDEVRAEIEAAMFTTLDAAPHGSDHLCCGRLGRADVLLTLGRRLGRPEWVEAARGAAVSVAGRAARERRFAVPSTEFEYAVFHPGFFKGLSGIGYQLLRIAAPSRVPSVLGFQARDRSGEP